MGVIPGDDGRGGSSGLACRQVLIDQRKGKIWKATTYAYAERRISWDVYWWDVTVVVVEGGGKGKGHRVKRSV